MASSKSSKARKGSSSCSKPEFERNVSLTDSSLFGLLSVINLDHICHKTFLINALLPDGSKRELTVNRFSLVKDVIHDICKEFKIDRPRVRLHSTSTPISLESNAALLEDHNIIIDEPRRESKDFKPEDPRLVNLRLLVNNEEKYLESLKRAVEVYGEALRKSSLNHLDHGIIFARLKPIQETTISLVLKLKEVLDNWSSTSCVASAFVNFPDLLWVYDNYYSRLAESKRLLRQKCKYDCEFLSMVNETKTTAKDSLGMLILLPARRIPHYKRSLTDILECTPDEHDDGRKLKVVIERIEQTLADRKEDIDEAENEFRLIEIQDKFPHDDLGLDEEKGLSGQKFKALMHARRRSAPATAIKAAFGKSLSKGSLHSIDISLTIHSEPTNVSSPQNNSIFINEGVVQLTTGVSSHDRYMFLFNDFLLIAKSKSSSNYKLKYRVKVSEMWLADCVDDVAESVRSPDKSFVIGWPTENFVASFSTTEDKNKWFEAITSNIASQKELQESKTATIKIRYEENESLQSSTKTLLVGHFDDANKVVQMALDQFNILSKESNDFQLWILYKEGAYPLIGHEFPFAIQMNQHRETSVLDDSDIITDPDFPTSPIVDTTNNNESHFQFVLRKSRKLSNKVSNRRWIRKPMAWKMNKKGSGGKSPSFEVIISTGKVFGLPLEQLTSDDELVPKQINEFLLRLFRYGPSTSGVFRKTPNQREVKELKEEIDEEKEISLEETSVHVVAGLMKEFLRKLPDAVWSCEHYEEFLSTNDISDQSERTREITRLLENLPSANVELIKRFFCVLHHISHDSEHNNMTSFNLGVCVAPSMLWPLPSVMAETAEHAKNTAPQFVEFVIEHFPEIFGEDALRILGDKSEIVVDVPIITENGESESFEIFEEPLSRSISLHHSDTNLYRVENNEDNSGHSGTLLTVKDNRATQSRSTPSSPVNERKKLDRRTPNDISRKIHSAFYHPKFSPRHNRHNSDNFSTNHDTEKSRDSIRNDTEKSRDSIRNDTEKSRDNIRNDTEKSRDYIRNDTEKSRDSVRNDTEKSRDSLKRRKTPIILTSTTTSAELIEHSSNMDEDSKTKASGSVLNGNEPEPAVLKKTVLPKRDGVLHFASSQSFYVAPAHIAERVYCVDRRRQPAAPSYHQHMQKQRSNLRLNLPDSSPGSSDRDEVPTGNKSTVTKVGLALMLSPNSEKIRDALIADPYMYTRFSSSSSHVSPVSSERSAPSKFSTGSETSISSLSSNDEYMDAETTTIAEEKPDFTRLQHIRDLLDVSGYANPLRISPETASLISETKGQWGHLIADDCSDMDDYQRMTMAEETYV